MTQTRIAKVTSFVDTIQAQIVLQALQVALIAVKLLQMVMTNAVPATSAAQEKAIANPMLSVTADLYVEPKTVPQTTQATTTVA